jgi:tetratricopeptide (TPR) repeat protein
LLRLAAPDVRDAALQALIDSFGFAIPGAATYVKVVDAAFSSYRAHRATQERKFNDVALGESTGGLSDPVDLLEDWVTTWTQAEFPFILVIEDLHDADSAMLELTRRLLDQDSARNRVLIVATAWPEGMSGAGSTNLNRLLSQVGAEFLPVDALDIEAATELVGQSFGDTDEVTINHIASRWPNPLALGLVLDEIRAEARWSVAGKITATLDEIDQIPPELQGVYNKRFLRFPDHVKRALVLDVICTADLGDTHRVTQPMSSVLPSRLRVPFDPQAVVRAASSVPVEVSMSDHDLALLAGWLTQHGTWLALTEPDLASTAWANMRSRGVNLAGSAWDLRMHLARDLAKVINAEMSDRPDWAHLRRGQLLDESAWLMVIAPSFPDHPDIQLAATRASLNLFNEKSWDRPQEAIPEFSIWFDRWLDPAFPQSSEACESLAYAHLRAGQSSKALPLFEQAFARARAKFDPAHPRVIRLRETVALHAGVGGEHERAIQLYREALSEARNAPDHDGARRIHRLSESLAGVMARAGKETDALELRRSRLVMEEAALDPEYNSLAEARLRLAQQYRETGQLETAIELLEETIHGRPSGLTWRIVDLNVLAQAYRQAGRADAACDLYSFALAHAEGQESPCRPLIPDLRRELGTALSWGSRHVEAIALLESEVEEARLAHDSYRMLFGVSTLAHAYEWANRVDDSIRLLAETVATEQAEPDFYDEGGLLRSQLGRCYEDAGQFDDAILLREEELSQLATRHGRGHPRTRRAQEELDETIRLSKLNPPA